jgi:hypothetical protein
MVALRFFFKGGFGLWAWFLDNFGSFLKTQEARFLWISIKNRPSLSFLNGLLLILWYYEKNRFCIYKIKLYVYLTKIIETEEISTFDQSIIRYLYFLYLEHL